MNHNFRARRVWEGKDILKVRRFGAALMLMALRTPGQHYGTV